MTPEESKQGLISINAEQLVLRMDQRLDLMDRLIEEIPDSTDRHALDNMACITLEVANRFIDDPESIDFSKYRLIDDDAAHFLSDFSWDFSFNVFAYLVCISDKSAKYIAKYPNLLDLSDLKNLSVESARALSAHSGEGGLVLDGLTNLSDAVTEALSEYNGTLNLDGITNLSDKSAGSLAKHRGNLSLGGLRSLSDSAAECLSRHAGHSLSLYSLSHLSTRSAAAFSNYEGFLSLGNLSSLSDEAAEALSKQKGSLYLGAESLSDSVIIALSKHQGDSLSLHALKTLTERGAEALSKYKGNLDVGPESLTEAAIIALSKHQGNSLFLNNLKTLTETGAEALSKYKGDLLLCELESKSKAVEEALAKCRGYEPIE